jgi:hypothetical protein
VAEATVVLAGVLDQVEAALVRWLSVLDARTVWLGDGARSAGAWLGERAEISRKVATAKAHTARELRACPQLDAAFAHGRIGAAKVRAALQARQAWPERFAEDEAVIVAEIEPLTVDEALIVLRRWATLAGRLKESQPDPQPDADDGHPTSADGADGTPGAARNPHLDNQVHLSTTFDGTVVGDLKLDAVAGAEVQEAIAARIDHLFAIGTFTTDDGLNQAARRAWALRDLLADGTVPSTRQGKPRPSVSIRLDERTAAGAPIDDLDDLLARRCELADGTPIPLATAQRLLCHCTLTTLVQRTLADGQIEIVGVTDVLRDATWRQRAALAVRDGGCAFPGCDALPERCHAHHVQFFEHQGPTLLHNLALVCSFHHHLIHEGGWKLRTDSGGELLLWKPDGTPVPLPPRGHKVAPPERPPDRPPG